MDRVNNKRTKSNTLGRNTSLTSEAESKLVKRLWAKPDGAARNGCRIRKEKQYLYEFQKWNPKSGLVHCLQKTPQFVDQKPRAVEYARKKAIDPFIVYPYLKTSQKCT